MRKWNLLTAVLAIQCATVAADAQALSLNWHGSTPDNRPSCVATTQENMPPLYSESIGIVFGRDVPRKLVEQAVEQWSRCAGYGVDFPPLLIGQPGSRTIEVKLNHAYRGGRRCGGFAGRTIVLYSFAKDQNGRTHFCGSRADGLAHELGHVLGLLDAPMEAGCRDHAMAVIDASSRDRRQIQPEECLSVGRRFLTPYEIPKEAGSDSVRLASSGLSRF